MLLLTNRFSRFGDKPGQTHKQTDKHSSTLILESIVESKLHWIIMINRPSTHGKGPNKCRVSKFLSVSKY